MVSDDLRYTRQGVGYSWLLIIGGTVMLTVSQLHVAATHPELAIEYGVKGGDADIKNVALGLIGIGTATRLTPRQFGKYLPGSEALELFGKYITAAKIVLNDDDDDDNDNETAQTSTGDSTQDSTNKSTDD
jgi:hypothetical protein